MKFPVSRFAIIILIAWSSAEARAFQAPSRKQLPNFDKRTANLQTSARQENNIAAKKKLFLDLKIRFDEILGTPIFVSAEHGFLKIDPTNQIAAKFSSNDVYRATKNFLETHRSLFGHGPEVLSDAKIVREFVSAHNGLRTVVWQQRVNDIPVFESLLISHTTKNAELVNLSSRFLPEITAAKKKNSAQLTAQDAIAFAAKNTGAEISAGRIVTLDEAQNAERKQNFKVPVLNGKTFAQLVWFPLHENELLLCWEIILTSRQRGEMFRVLVDAQSGEIVLRRNLTSYISDATYRVFTSDSPTPFSPGYSSLSSSQPNGVSRQLVTTSAFNTNASPNGWINDGVNETLGNNVDAHLDRDADDFPDLPRPQGSLFRVFDFPVDLSVSPSSYGDAAVTELFFLSNWYHDKLYEFGFDEAAGNFQDDNFGRGGTSGDAVQADTQDGEYSNNANFSAAGDGSPGRMQMYIFTGPNPDRDGSLDAEVVFHELTHGLSNRRVGGGVGLYEEQSSGMGEGWSDFYALSLLSEPSDDVNGNFALGAYTAYQFAGLTENYYFGLRRYPYSPDLTKSPLTFRDIDPAQADPHSGVSHNPVVGDSATEVHNMGEVWCVVLWDARAALINKYGTVIGNQMMLQLVTDGMNLSPPNPNFLEARDAILQGDEVNNEGANYEELWSAFAKRGMGFFAQSPASYTTSGLVESFALPDDLLISPASLSVASGKVGGPFSPSSQTLTLSNMRTNPIQWTVASTQNWLSLSKTNGTLAEGDTDSVTLTFNSADNVLTTGIYSANLDFTNVTTGVGQPRSLTLAIAQPASLTETFYSNDFDLENRSLTFTPDGSTSFYAVCKSGASQFPTDPVGGNELTLTDDDYAEVNLSGAEQVGVFGVSNSVFYIGSNGYITFDSGDDAFDASLKTHFHRARVSALFDDFLPAPGQISWKQLSDRAAVTFQNVREYNLPNTNNFQIEMFYDGRIRLTYLQINAQIGVVGLSRGTGVPPAFVKIDFSAVDVCGARPQITQAFLNSSGNFALEFMTEPNGIYIVQTSTNLTNWMDIIPSILGTGSNATWKDDSPAENQTTHFFRIRRDL